MPFVYFQVTTVLKNRNGEAQKEPKLGAKPIKGSNPPQYEDEDVRDATHADVALMALDSPLKSDQKAMEADPTKWVKAIGRREDVAAAIIEARAGDGWAELSEDDRDMLMDRLAECALVMTNANIGPVLRALKNAPKKKPESEAAE